MEFSRPIGHAFLGVSRHLARWFPVPELLLPHAAGVDISDSSIKWLVLEPADDNFRIKNYGDVSLKEGIIVSGAVHDPDALAAALRGVRGELGGIRAAHAALPEEAAYVFSMQVPAGTPRSQVLRMIEFEFENRVPIPPSEAVYDYNVIPSREAREHEEIGVTVFPRDLAEAYANAFNAAGMTLLSLEVEARSIARAISDETAEEPITLIVDFGRARTGFAVVNRGIPIFTSTVEVGGDLITNALIESAGIQPEDVEYFKNEVGLRANAKQKKELEAVTGTATALADEISRHFHYWDTRRNEHGERVTPVGLVLLVGGSSNLNGLSDYIAGRVQAPASVGDVWRHIIDFDSYVPPIDKRTSIQYATAAGLALRGHA